MSLFSDFSNTTPTLLTNDNKINEIISFVVSIEFIDHGNGISVMIFHPLINANVT